MEEERKKCLKNVKKNFDEIERKEDESYKKHKENLESIYNENLDLLFDGLKKLKGEEKINLFNK